MPAIVQKRGEKYRVVEAGTNALVRGPSGNPVDGGGHESKAKAQRQAGAINSRKNFEDAVIDHPFDAGPFVDNS
jgi:hypothetical protein